MRKSLQITFRHLDRSPALEARIRELAQRLGKFSAHITGCHVAIESPHRHRHQGNLFEVRIDVNVPGKDITIRHSHALSHAHEDPYIALRDAFRAAVRKLQDYEQKRRRTKALSSGRREFPRNEHSPNPRAGVSIPL
jgi:ribosome-associated translation inhibitor RaiA